MIAYLPGTLVKSKAGHDKNKLFVILDEKGTYVSLVDGRIRTLSRPKLKKKKHVELVSEGDKTLSSKLVNQERITDEEIKYYIRRFKREDRL